MKNLILLFLLLLFSSNIMAQAAETAVEWRNRMDSADLGSYEYEREAERLKESDTPQAKARLGYLYRIGKGVDQDMTKAFELSLEAAEQGNAFAQYSVGWHYGGGQGVLEDQKTAFSWYEKAVENGDAFAKVNLSNAYLYGSGAPQDINKGLDLAQEAAAQGNPFAMYNLGVVYRYAKYLGNQVKVDQQKALSWLQKAAEKGHAGALYELGLWYDAEGDSMDRAKANDFYRQAADKGDAEAMFKLAYNYSYGRGIDKDFSKAIALYREAAAKDHSTAMNNLGAHYEKGEGVEKDLEKARSWYKKAAAHSSAKGEENFKRLDTDLKARTATGELFGFVNPIVDSDLKPLEFSSSISYKYMRIPEVLIDQYNDKVRDEHEIKEGVIVVVKGEEFDISHGFGADLNPNAVQVMLFDCEKKKYSTLLYSDSSYQNNSKSPPTILKGFLEEPYFLNEVENPSLDLPKALYKQVCK